MSDEKARLFVALDLPADVRREMAQWARDAVGDAPGLRPLPPDTLHVTLCFLGWRPLADAPAIADLALACAMPVERLATTQAAWLPPRRPRVLAIDLEDPDAAVATIQAGVSDALEVGAGYEPERRAYRPHVTVARVARGARPTPELPEPPALAFAGEAVTLYRSVLRREGARYEPIARRTLAAA